MALAQVAAGADSAVVPAPCDTETGAEQGGEAAAAAAAGEPQVGEAAAAGRSNAAQCRKSRPCFRYGNYRGYYGYRVGAELEDHRLLALQP